MSEQFQGVTISDPSVDRIKWTEVTQEEYEAVHFSTPHRATYEAARVVRWELGRKPTQLPTGQYAVVGPSKELREREVGYVPYLLVDGTWYGIGADDMWVADTDEVIDFIEYNRFEVIFPGV